MKLKSLYKTSVYGLLLSMSVSSCNLDYDPVSSYSDVTEGVTNDKSESEVIFKDKAAVESHLVTLYNQMRDRQEHWYVDALLIAEAHSDNAYAGTTGAEVIPYENNSIDGSNSVLGRDWDRFLEDIARANKLIVGVDNVEGLSESDKECYKSQAKIFRAMIMFDMARMWGSFPVITTVAGDITSENVDEMYPVYFPKQNTEEEAYKQIEKDLLEALNAPSALENDPSNKTLFTKSVARALLAKVYAEKPIRDYDKVIKYANELKADGFALVENFNDLWGTLGEDGSVTDCKMRNTKESILEGQFHPGNGNWCTWMFGRDLSNWDSQFSWAKWITPSRDLIKAFKSEKDEIRFNESIRYYECNWSNYYPMNEYPFMYKCRSAFNSIIYLRYADILLLKAEALIMKKDADLDAAADIIDEVRARVELAKLPAATRNSKEAMIEALLKERRLELAFEGERWYDLVRLNKVEEVMNAVYSKDSGRKGQINLFNENSYRLPIPQGAIDQNDNLVQNPGY